VACLAVAVAAGCLALASCSSTTDDPREAVAAQATSAPPPAPRVEASPAPGAMLVRAVDPRAPRHDGRLYELSQSGEAKQAGRLACKRVHAVGGGPGLCLALGETGVDYDGVVFDSRYRETVRFPIDGVPDRARVSPDGRYGAYTSFDRSASEGYFESTGDFSTYARIVALDTGEVLLRFEDLVLTRNGDRISTAGAEFWGVTFAPGGRYYATAAIDGEHYLISGTVRVPLSRVLRKRVECPALSPDGRRIAYKRRIGDSNRWRLHVLELDSGRDVALAERRSIDDQPEWAGSNRIAYSDDRSVFVVPADGTGAPRRVATNATSPGPSAR
jgi:hypothetical protein